MAMRTALFLLSLTLASTGCFGFLSSWIGTPASQCALSKQFHRRCNSRVPFPPVRKLTTVRASTSGDNGGTDRIEIEYYSEEEQSVQEKSRNSLGRVEELGLFPLGMVLNPGAQLPLNIFEMRYRQLFNRAWDGDKKVGIVMWNGQRNIWARVGTVAEITKFQSQPDGRILTLNEGRERFRVLKVTRPGSEESYIRALVEYIDDTEDDADLPALETRVWELLQSVLKISNELYGKSLDLKNAVKDLAPNSRGGEATSQEETKLSDSARRRLFSFAVAQVLDLPLEEQQQLLQTQSTRLRFDKQKSVLEQAQHYLAAQMSVKKALVLQDQDDDKP